MSDPIRGPQKRKARRPTRRPTRTSCSEDHQRASQKNSGCNLAPLPSTLARTRRPVKDKGALMQTCLSLCSRHGPRPLRVCVRSPGGQAPADGGPFRCTASDQEWRPALLKPPWPTCAVGSRAFPVSATLVWQAAVGKGPDMWVWSLPCPRRDREGGTACAARRRCHVRASRVCWGPGPLLASAQERSGMPDRPPLSSAVPHDTRHWTGERRRTAARGRVPRVYDRNPVPPRSWRSGAFAPGKACPAYGLSLIHI